MLKSRHYILEFLRRRGFIYRDGTHWTTKHLNWIRHVLMPGKLPEEDRIVLGEYLPLLEYKLQRRDDLDRRIEALALIPRYKPVVDRIGFFHGFKTQAAMVLATELGDLRRFESPRQLMAYVGLVPSEHSSGNRRRLGAITKAGNARVHHVLIQAAWHSRKRPAVGPSLRRRQSGQDPAVIAHAWKCQHRLYKLFHRVSAGLIVEDAPASPSDALLIDKASPYQRSPDDERPLNGLPRDLPQSLAGSYPIR